MKNYSNDPKEKSVSGGIRNTSDSNQIEHFAGDSNGFTAFNYAEKASKVQCDMCQPAAYKQTKPPKLCPTCEAVQKKRQNDLTNLLTTPPTVRRLDRRCFSCNRGLTPARMASGSIICRTCAGEFKSKGATAQNLFVEKVKANVGKFLKGVAGV